MVTTTLRNNGTGLQNCLHPPAVGYCEGLNDPSRTQIMIHFDNGANNGMCRYFFDNLTERNVEYDLIGLSFYPRWHGTFDSLEVNLADLSERYDKDVIVVETAYPWTLEWNDDTGNIWGSEGRFA